MSSVRALDPIKAQTTPVVADVASTTTPAVATPTDTTPALASAATLSVIDGGAVTTPVGLLAPTATKLSLVRASDKPQLAAYVGGSVHDRAVAIQRMVNSCTFGLFCISAQEERDIVGILNATTPAERPQLIAELSQMGVLNTMINKFSNNDSQMVRNMVRMNIGALRDPVLIAETLGAIQIYSDAEVIAIAQSLRAQVGNAQADQVLQMLVAKGMLSRPLPFMSPLYLYNNCDSFWGVLQHQQMATWLEQQRQVSAAKLEVVLQSFPPGSIAAAQLRTQLQQQYTVERVNDQIATMSCLSQTRYRDYYHTYYPDWYRTHQGPVSGDGFPRGPSSGDGFPQGPSSSDGFPQSPSSGDGFPTTPPYHAPSSPSSDGFETHPSTPPPVYRAPAPSRTTSGDGFETRPYTPPPVYRAPAPAPYHAPSSSRPSSSSSGDGF